MAPWRGGPVEKKSMSMTFQIENFHPSGEKCNITVTISNIVAAQNTH